MIRILIVGFGNPLRSDDGLGWHVARELERELSGRNAKLQVIAVQQLTPDLAEVASRAELVLFVDAAYNRKPGNLHCEPIEPAASLGRYSHELSPAVVLALAKELYGRCPPAHLLTIAGESFETGETMSPSVVAAIPELMTRIKQLTNCD